MMYGLYTEGKLIIHGVLVYDVRLVLGFRCTGTEGKLIIHGVLIYDVRLVHRG